MYYENFERLCKDANTNPSQVSRGTGISTATLTSWKQGKCTPKTDKLQLIANFFNVPLSAITGMQEVDLNNQAIDSITNFLKYNHEYIELLDTARQVKKKDIDRVTAMIRLMIDI